MPIDGNSLSHAPVSAWFAFAAFVVGAAFAIHVAYRFIRGRRPYLLAWAIGLGLFATAALLEAYGLLPSTGGSSSALAAFRLYFVITGANVAFLGVGTIFLLTPRVFAWVCVVIFLALVVLLAYNVYSMPSCPSGPIGPHGQTVACDHANRLDSSPLANGKGFGVNINAVAPVRLGLFHAAIDIPASLAFIGGALWSAYVFARKRQNRERMVGNILIAAGAMIIAGAGSLVRLNLVALPYIGEVATAALMYAGFIIISRGPRYAAVGAAQAAPAQPAPGPPSP